MLNHTMAVRIWLCLFLGCGLAAQAADPPSGPERWEADIAAFEKEDREKPRPEGAILFTGSSSIRLWKVEESFPDRPVINRGFGGSQYADAAHFAKRIILPHRPAIVVLYSGDNDIAKGKSPEQVLQDLQSLVATVHEELPATRIVVIGVKPSISRWSKIETIRETNRRMREWLGQDPRRSFVDVDPPMLNADGQPRPELFRKDGLHLNDVGYELWSGLLRPHLSLPAGSQP